MTATRTPQPIEQLIADVTIIDADEIARSGAQSLTELLQRQAGVEILQNGGPGSTSGVFIRGANRGQTLLLIDGLRVSSASVGAPSLEAVPLDQVERIEILRGPASSLYGADAIGGVIQMFTRTPSEQFTGNAERGLRHVSHAHIVGGPVRRAWAHCVSPCKPAGAAATGSTRAPTPLRSSSTRIATATRATMSGRTRR